MSEAMVRRRQTRLRSAFDHCSTPRARGLRRSLPPRQRRTPQDATSRLTRSRRSSTSIYQPAEEDVVVAVGDSWLAAAARMPRAVVAVGVDAGDSWLAAAARMPRAVV